MVDLRNASEDSLKKAIESKNEIQFKYEELIKENLEFSDIKSSLQADIYRLEQTLSSERDERRHHLDSLNKRVALWEKTIDRIAFEVFCFSKEDIDKVRSAPIDAFKQRVEWIEHEHVKERNALLGLLNEAKSGAQDLEIQKKLWHEQHRVVEKERDELSQCKLKLTLDNESLRQKSTLEMELLRQKLVSEKELLRRELTLENEFLREQLALKNQDLQRNLDLAKKNEAISASEIEL
ncbi:hypothetical protein BC829DRAFT_109575 [Chytridium lagenaria]|nr:hypothetical protein BC829DRAFT_109575 [Chytridium lagenaria]